jgi:ATP/maltotriose-dependent transcriptional regulator MalT/DNA-binding SARP family transcriptional activator
VEPRNPENELAAEGSEHSVAFAKTTRPAIGSLVPRERLFALLDGTPGRTVAWISGSPGSGKTSLAASYVEARRLRCLWYQVDPDDADVATFFHYLGHAARKLEGARAREQAAVAPRHGPELASYARSFFRQLFGRAKGPLALVLDNLHAVPLESELHVVLEAAFGQVPKNALIVVTSRRDPPASLARLRVTGEMVCVGANDLRLAPEELTAVAKLRSHPLGAQAAAELHDRTRGWAAGVVLMLEHRKLSGRMAELPGDATPQLIFDYLAGEIFDRFEAETRQFLLRIACLPRMTAELAQALSGEEKAARLLLNLALNHYFVDEIQSDEGRVFQLHPLLRDFLRRRAAQDLPEALGAGQLRRAALLLRAAGQTEDAVSLLMECRDWAAVARIAAEDSQRMLEQGRGESLAMWIESLPEALRAADPRLLHALGACRAETTPRAARRYFEQAFEGFQRAGDLAGAAQSACGAIDATLVEFDDLATLDRWTGVLAGMLREFAAQIPPRVSAQAVAALGRALLVRNPGSEELDGWLAALFRGDFTASAMSIDALQASGSAHNALSIAIASALQQLVTGASDVALRIAQEALAASESEGGGHSGEAWLRVVGVAAALDAGQRDPARSELQRLEAAGGRARRGDRAVQRYLRAWLAALDEDAAGALREARAAAETALEAGLPWLECITRAALSRLLADAGDRRGCDTQLRSAEALAERLASPSLRFFVRLAAAEAALATGEEAAALAAVKSAFALGREHGYRHAPWWRSRPVADLCVLAMRHGVEPEYARALARERNLVPQAPPLRIRDWPWPFRIRTLGGFQLLRGTAPVEFAGKGPGRPLELLKVLIALGGENVRAEQLADALWPHVEADFAHKSFTAALHRLRRLFGDDDALTLRDGRLSLNPALVWLDTWALEQILGELDDALRLPNPERAAPVLRALAGEALALYRGAFLPDESEQPAYIANREQARARLLRSLSRLARQREETGEGSAAAECYLQLIEADDLFEAPYRYLMQCLQRCGEASEARSAYERLRTVLATKLKVMPSAETQAVYASLGTPGK